MTYKKAWTKEDLLTEVYSAIIGEYAYRAQKEEAARVAGNDRVEPPLLLDSGFDPETRILISADEIRDLFNRGFEAGIAAFNDCRNERLHFTRPALMKWEQTDGKWIPAHYGELQELETA